MSSAKKFMERLKKLEGAVTEAYDPFANVVQSPSPSLNFVFGNTHGLPAGFSLLLYGPPKGGKSLISNMMAGQLHRDDPEAIVVKFNTEMRELGQMTEAQAKVWGIDRDRYIAYDVNSPDLVFDPIEKEINEMCQEGAKIKLIIIDSINSISGRRAMNADTIMTQQIGDTALTIGDGLKRILAVQRKHKIAMVLTCQERAEMDMAEQMRGNKTKAAAPFAVRHHCEYFMYVEPNRSKEGRTDLLGNEFRDEALADIKDNAEKTGHKIRVTMKDSSLGPKGRVGEFTLDYHKGLINMHEELFLLCLNRGIIEKPSNVKYGFKGTEWHGKPATLEAIRTTPELQQALMKELRLRDLAGVYGNEPVTEESK